MQTMRITIAFTVKRNALSARAALEIIGRFSSVRNAWHRCRDNVANMQANYLCLAGDWPFLWTMGFIHTVGSNRKLALFSK